MWCFLLHWRLSLIPKLQSEWRELQRTEVTQHTLWNVKVTSGEACANCNNRTSPFWENLGIQKSTEGEKREVRKEANAFDSTVASSLIGRRFKSLQRLASVANHCCLRYQYWQPWCISTNGGTLLLCNKNLHLATYVNVRSVSMDRSLCVRCDSYFHLFCQF